MKYVMRKFSKDYPKISNLRFVLISLIALASLLAFTAMAEPTKATLPFIVKKPKPVHPGCLLAMLSFQRGPVPNIWRTFALNKEGLIIDSYIESELETKHILIVTEMFRGEEIKHMHYLGMCTDDGVNYKIYVLNIYKRK